MSQRGDRALASLIFCVVAGGCSPVAAARDGSAGPAQDATAHHDKISVMTGQCLAEKLSADAMLIVERDPYEAYPALQKAADTCRAAGAEARRQPSSPACAEFASLVVDEMTLKAKVVNGDGSPDAVYRARKAAGAAEAGLAACSHSQDQARANLGLPSP